MAKQNNLSETSAKFVFITQKLCVIWQCIFFIGVLILGEQPVIWSIVLFLLIFLDAATAKSLCLERYPLSKGSRRLRRALLGAVLLLPWGTACLCTRSWPVLERQLAQLYVLLLSAIEMESLRILWNASHILRVLSKKTNQ